MYTTMLELAISMAFLFLMLSAASSAIQEIIANMWRWRAKTLEKGIASLLQSKAFKDELYQLPLLQGLCSPNARGQQTHKPSYIPSSTLALAVLHLAEQKRLNLLGSSAVPVGNPPSAPTGSAQADKTTLLLQSLLRGAKDVEEQKKRLEDWFDNSMDRISGWYKRRSHAVLWIIGILLCLLVNADSISLANAFWNDQTLRSAMAAAATKYVENAPQQNTSGAKIDSSGNTVAGQSTGRPQSATQTPSAGPAPAKSTNQPASKQSQSPGGGQSAQINKRAGSQGGAQTQNAGKDNTKAPGQTGNNSGTGGGFSGGASAAQGSTADDTPFKRLEKVREELTKVNIPLGWCHIPQSVQNATANCWPDFTVAQAKVSKAATGGKDRQQPAIGSNSSNSGSDGPSTPNTTAISDSRDNSDQKKLPLNDPRLRMPLTWKYWNWWTWKFLGIALTALAISQGAPFWFDLLQKAVKLRLAGDAPDEKQKKK